MEVNKKVVPLSQFEAFWVGVFWLGVENPRSLNKALLCKWNWWFENERVAFKGNLWGGRRKLGSSVVRESFWGGLWKSIRKWCHLVSLRLFVVGNG